MDSPPKRVSKHKAADAIQGLAIMYADAARQLSNIAYRLRHDGDFEKAEKAAAVIFEKLNKV